MSARTIGVIDIGKSNAKFAVVDLETRTEIAVRRTPNVVKSDGPYPHYDIESLWDFVCGAIADLNRTHPLDALSVTTHGASAVLIDAEGALTLPVLDYEHAGPDSLAADYDAARPPFAESLSPRLPMGLNLGAQLFWQARAFPDAFARTRWIVPYPQYWSFRLTGAIAAEMTSLGCHTDLWDFRTNRYSSLVAREGWLEKAPEIRPASAVLGSVEPALVRRLGVRAELPVFAGIHDSNASLLPHLLDRRPPFAVVSTGTWVVVFAPGGDLGGLDPARDCLANIDALGRPVPSARFMGGREFALVTGDAAATAVTETDVARVLEKGIMLLPSMVQGSGPFPARMARWSEPEASIEPGCRLVAASFYLALMTAECLHLVGARGPSIVEGPFAANVHFVEMLAAATGRPAVVAAGSATGTSIGAALLARMEHHRSPGQPASSAIERAVHIHYARQWRNALGVSS